MSSKSSCVVGLVLLAFLATVGAKPTGDTAQPIDTLSNCPHVIDRVATPEEISGRWYTYEFLAEVPGDAPPSPRELGPCFRNVISVEAEQLTMVGTVIVNGTENQSRNFTYTRDSSGRWHGTGDVEGKSFSAGLSANGLLLLCGDNPAVAPMPGGSHLSTALGREATTATEAARKVPAAGSSLVSARFDLSKCTPSASSHP